MRSSAATIERVGAGLVPWLAFPLTQLPPTARDPLAGPSFPTGVEASGSTPGGGSARSDETDEGGHAAVRDNPSSAFGNASGTYPHKGRRIGAEFGLQIKRIGD